MHEFIRNSWIEHLNLPIQSGSNAVLAQMNRRYTVEQLRGLFGGLDDAGFRDFDTHIIVGFPGETNEDFRQTVALVLEIKPRYVLLSKYLESPRAPSAQLPGKVSDGEARQRMDEASRRFVEAGIICNWEGSDLAKERLRRLNSINANIDEG
jgi:tRNA-2-methylthio-N6-dimethylallyladenosine synthase